MHQTTLKNMVINLWDKKMQIFPLTENLNCTSTLMDCRSNKVLENKNTIKNQLNLSFNMPESHAARENFIDLNKP